MKKFVIQWRKFESKKSYVNEVMKFEFYRIFLEFILIFQVSFGFNFFIKIAKRVYFNRVRPAKLTWHGAHTWRSHARTCGRVCGHMNVGLAVDGPTG